MNAKKIIFTSLQSSNVVAEQCIPHTCYSVYKNTFSYLFELSTKLKL